MSAKQPRGRNESAEGSGNARRRWFQFLSEMDPRTLDITGFHNVTSSVWERYGNKQRSPIDEHFSSIAAKDSKEFAELVGFWVQWHRLGGFDLMEEHGWNRATIYRRIKKFRERFGAHPDDFEFSWIKVDVETAWNEDVDEVIGFHTRTGDDDAAD